MKRTLIVLCALFVVVGLIAVVGCGGTETATEESQTETEDVISMDEDVTVGIVGTYTEAGGGGGGGSITFSKDGTFEGNAWGSEKKGTYTIKKNEETSDTIILTFDDGTTENWSVGISMGKVAAVTSPEGVQYDKAQ